MLVTINSIDTPTKVAQGQGAHLTRFDVAFTGTTLSGQGHLFVIHSPHSPPQIDIAAVRKQVIGRSLDVDCRVETISEFSQSVAHEHDQVVPLGPPRAFAFVGRIVQHFFTGEGSVFQVADVELLIGVSMVPPDSLEVPEGTWVSFKAEGLSLWLRQ